MAIAKMYDMGKKARMTLYAERDGTKWSSIGGGICNGSTGWHDDQDDPASLRRGVGRRLCILVRLEAILLYNAHRELDLQ
jgi:hypothetical protein